MTDCPFRHRLYTVEQVRALDRRAAAGQDTSGYELMNRAAWAALGCLRKHWPQVQRIAVYCGPGNNGGDGALLGLLASKAGIGVSLVALPGEPRGDAALARQAYQAAGGNVHEWRGEGGLPDADLHVDALYGTGLRDALPESAAALVRRIQASGRPILSLDVPSGLNADTGHCAGVAVHATVTVSFIAAKRGLYTGRASAHVGLLELDPLDLPESLWREQPVDAQLLDAVALPPRRRDAHKGDFGHLLAIGGDHGMGGAIRLCGEAGLRTGAGRVSVATRAEHITALNSGCPELMAHAVNGPQALEPLLQRADTVVLGPGLGRDAWGHALWLTALDSARPLVLDADGLNLLALEKRRFEQPVVLTPHPGEAARLLGTAVAAVAADRFAAVRALAHAFNAVVVLKGSGTLVADADGRVGVCPWGNPGMASGGMGDLLAGIIAALMGQGMSPWQAATCGVGLHARAGDMAARKGERGLIARDLLGPLRGLLNGIDP